MKFKLLLASVLLISFGCIANAQTPKKKTSNNQTKSTSTQTAKPKSPSAATAPSTAPSRKPATAVNTNVLGQGSLPEPEKHGGKPFMDVFSNIRIENSIGFSPEELRTEQISNLLFTACGKTEKESNSYTAFYTGETPSIDIYVVTREQIMKYDKEEHTLLIIRKGHFLEKITMQRDMPIEAPLAILYTCSKDILPSPDTDSMPFFEEGMNCGAIMQNVFLYCMSEELSCKAISISDQTKQEFQKLMNLRNGQILYGQIVGMR